MDVVGASRVTCSHGTGRQHVRSIAARRVPAFRPQERGDGVGIQALSATCESICYGDRSALVRRIVMLSRPVGDVELGSNLFGTQRNEIREGVS